MIGMLRILRHVSGLKKFQAERNQRRVNTSK